MPDDLTLTLDLVRRAQTGSADALERLLDRYYPRVRKIIRCRLGSRLHSRIESADVLQETFIEAVRRFDRFEMRDEASLVNWLSRIAERQVMAAVDYHGAAKRDVAREVPLEGEARGLDTSARPGPGRSPAPTPSGAVAESEEARRVELAIAGLPEEQREVIVLRDYVGASWRAIAKELGKSSEDAARMLHARALVALGKRVRASG